MPVIEELHPNEDSAHRLRTIRLCALENAPDAFGSTLQDTQHRPLADWVQQLRTLTTFLAVADARDVGMVRIGTDSDNANIVWLLSMWVAPDARGQGIGDALVEAALNAARQRGAGQIRLDVADENHHAGELYTRHGFTPNGVRGTLPPPREHIAEYQMQRSLSGN